MSSAMSAATDLMDAVAGHQHFQKSIAVHVPKSSEPSEVKSREYDAANCTAMSSDAATMRMVVMLS